VAAVKPTETVHFHPDHLGSPRLISGTGGAFRAYHLYHPYGAEATAISQDTERMKFTGHERDLGVAGSAADDLDSMHARFYSPLAGRFQSTDPVLGGLADPRSWNRFAYAGNNPMLFVDPLGLMECRASSRGANGTKLDCSDSIDSRATDPGEVDYAFLLQFQQFKSEFAAFKANSLSRDLAPRDYGFGGLSLRQGIELAQLAGQGGDCADPRCYQLGAIVDDFYGDPILASIAGSQAAGMVMLAGGAVTEIWPAAVGGARLGRVLFGKGGLVNSNRYLRIGFGRYGGVRVFRIGGRWVSRVTGRSHVDLWRGGPL
jgi:RHS repeat-associated protein